MSNQNELIDEIRKLIKTESHRAIVIQLVEQHGKYNTTPPIWRWENRSWSFDC